MSLDQGAEVGAGGFAPREVLHVHIWAVNLSTFLNLGRVPSLSPNASVGINHDDKNL